MPLSCFQRLALSAIRGYQRYISPRKGFACAWRRHTGHASCSTLGFRAVRRYGVARGLALIRQRTRLCGVAHRRFSPVLRRAPLSQRGDCDLGCDAPGDCDFPRGMGAFSCCDGCSCDWPSRDSKKHREDDKLHHIPPHRRA